MNERRYQGKILNCYYSNIRKIEGRYNHSIFNKAMIKVLSPDAICLTEVEKSININFVQYKVKIWDKIQIFLTTLFILSLFLNGIFYLKLNHFKNNYFIIFFLGIFLIITIIILYFSFKKQFRKVQIEVDTDIFITILFNSSREKRLFIDNIEFFKHFKK